jgi:transcriptional regulator with XRE-family HTH domain
MRNKLIQKIIDETPKEVEIFIDKYTDIVTRVHQILEKKGISQKDLAQKLGKHQSEIHKWLNGNHNLTLRSIAKLEAELGEPLLIVPKEKTPTEPIRKNKRTMVVHWRSTPIEPSTRFQKYQIQNKINEDNANSPKV